MKKAFSLLKAAFIIVLFLSCRTSSVFAENKVFSRTLARGAFGPDVSALQGFLKTMPDVYPEGSVTGYFGSFTEKAVKRFQSKYSLESIGIVGPKTRKKLGELFSTSQNTNQSRAAFPSQTRSGQAFGSNTKNWNAPTGGEIFYAENLPSCQGTELFGSPPATLSTYNNISPLGHTSSYNGNTGHVFPVDHMSFDLKHVTPGDRTTPSLPATLLAPGDVEIFKITHITYEKDGTVVGNDYGIFFAPCREVTGYFGHVTTISSKLQNAVNHADQTYCQPPFTTGGGGSLTFKQCNYSLLLPLKSGEEIATAGGLGVMTQGFDYGMYDMRIQPLPFIDPKYWTPQNLHAVCGLYYYPGGQVKTSLLNNIDNTKKDVNGFPDCGTNMWDKVHTIQGNWVLPNTPTGLVPDAEGLSVIHLYNDPNQGLIDWGGTIAPADRIQFNITTSGVVNRDPADVKADGSVYCFQDVSHGTAYARGVVLQLVDDNTLKAEYLTGACPSSPAFSSPTTYVR